MGSLEEERLTQMVHDFMESDPSPLPVSSNFRSVEPQPKSLILKVGSRILCFLCFLVVLIVVPCLVIGNTRECDRSRDESYSMFVHMRDAQKNTSLKKWFVSKLKMDGFDASICQNSWSTSLGCPAGDYEYIEIRTTENNGNQTRLIVDTDFRSQFELARPTQSYKDLTDTLPSVFAGSEEKLNEIISFLCSAAKQSLRERGLHVPPWRTSAYMQSKWLPPKKLRTDREEMMEGKGGVGLWAPPPPLMKANKGKSLGGGSGLSSQFSSMGINCC